MKFVALFCLAIAALHADDDLYAGWLDMYDLKFAAAHQRFDRWERARPADALGPASHAAGYLFSELARLGVLESELFVEDKSFLHRKKLQPDPEAKRLFFEQAGRTDNLADAALTKNASDADALLAKSLALGLRADYLALIERQNLAPLDYTKRSRAFAERLLQVDPHNYDSFLGPGVENYLLSLKPAPIRWILGMTGANTDRAKGIQELKLTAEHGHYLEPFAKLLLAVASLRAKDPGQAKIILQGLHARFPDNPLFARELGRLK
jgi:hypothetical protein